MRRGIDRADGGGGASPLVDYAHLDGNLLIANDPYRGVQVERGKLVLPERQALGLRPA